MNPEQSNPLGSLPPQTYGVPIYLYASATIAAPFTLPEGVDGVDGVVGVVALFELFLLLVFVLVV